jgi:hypothetical protein
MLKKLQFLFELPARLRQCLDMKMYQQAVRYYAKAKNVLLSYREMESFKGRLGCWHRARTLLRLDKLMADHRDLQ